MHLPRSYKKIAAELDKLIESEVRFRISASGKQSRPEKVNALIEGKIDDILAVHRTGEAASHIPALFSGLLQIKPGGRLYFHPDDLKKDAFEIYSGKKGRLHTLTVALLNTLKEEALIGLVFEKSNLFDAAGRKAAEVLQLEREAGEIRTQADNPGLVPPDDEASAIRFLEELAPLRVRLEKIEARHLELKQHPYIGKSLDRLQSAIAQASKSVTQKGARASAFLFEQARTILDNYNATKAAIPNLDVFVRQKEELERFAGIFERLGDEARRRQVMGFSETIDKTIAKLRRMIEKQKTEETAVLKDAGRRVNAAYGRFLEIKQAWTARGITADSDKRRIVAKLKKISHVLRSDGFQIKAREIDRFLNATGLAEYQKDRPPDADEARYLFYRKAFFILLPVTIGLAALCILHFF